MRQLLQVDDTKLECRWIGSPERERPTLVFLHDGLGCVDIWRDFPDRLADRLGLTAFIYSRAGYGRSDPVALPRGLDYEHTEALEVLPKVLEVAGIQRAILVGHSDGATIAIIYGGSAPQHRAEAIIAMAPHVFNEHLSIVGITAAKKDYEEGTLRPRLERLHGTNVDCAFRGWSDTWLHPDFRGWNIESMLPGIRVPVLAIQGEDDEYGSLDQVDAVMRQVSGPARSMIIPGCGHVPYREATTETLEAITDFLGDLGIPR